MEIWKKAWIDESRQIVSFEFLPDTQVYVALEQEFWDRIVALCSLGYRLQ